MGCSTRSSAAASTTTAFDMTSRRIGTWPMVVRNLAARRHADQRWRRTPARRDVLIALAGPTSGDSVGIRQRLRHPPPGDRHHRSRPGRYVRVHTVNPDRSLAERIYGNNRSRAASRIARVARGRHRQAAADTLKRVRRGLRPRRPRPCLHRTPYAHLLRQYVVDEPRLHVA